MLKWQPSLKQRRAFRRSQRRAVYTLVKEDTRRQLYSAESGWTASGSPQEPSPSCRLAGSRSSDSYAEP